MASPSLHEWEYPADPNDRPAGSAQRIVTVPATTNWFDTGVDVRPGERIVLSATGGGGDALRALIGKTGESPFFVGAAYRGCVTVGGRLFLSMNDTAASLADNLGFVEVSITILPSVRDPYSTSAPRPAVLMPADLFLAVAKLLLSGGRLQLSQTDEGTARLIDGCPEMSYVTFGPCLQGLGIGAVAIELPSLTLVDRAWFRVNNVHAEFNQDLAVRLDEGAVLLDVLLHASEPNARTKGRGYSFASMGATVRLAPRLEGGVLHLDDPTIELTGDLSLKFGDTLMKAFKHRILSEFATKLNLQLQVPAVRQPLENALAALFLGGRPNAGIASIAIDRNGVEIVFKA